MNFSRSSDWIFESYWTWLTLGSYTFSIQTHRNTDAFTSLLFWFLFRWFCELLTMKPIKIIRYSFFLHFFCTLNHFPFKIRHFFFSIIIALEWHFTFAKQLFCLYSAFLTLYLWKSDWRWISSNRLHFQWRLSNFGFDTQSHLLFSEMLTIRHYIKSNWEISLFSQREKIVWPF